MEDLVLTEVVDGLFFSEAVEDLASTETAEDLPLSAGAMVDLGFFTEAVGDFPLTKAEAVAEG